MADYPDGKETFPAWVDRDLAIAELGTRILKANMDPVRDCVERIQDALGYDLLDGYADVKERLDALGYSDEVFVWSLLGGV